MGTTILYSLKLLLLFEEFYDGEETEIELWTSLREKVYRLFLFILLRLLLSVKRLIRRIVRSIGCVFCYFSDKVVQTKHKHSTELVNAVVNDCKILGKIWMHFMLQQSKQFNGAHLKLSCLVSLVGYLLIN